MKLHSISLKDKALVRRYLRLTRHELSTYAFANIFIWKKLFEIRWTVIRKTLCVFFKDTTGCFAYLAPLPGADEELLREAFAFMDSCNTNKDISRIENVEQSQVPLYEKLGYRVREKPGDYLCDRNTLVQLRGDALRHKRSACNYFVKHYAYTYAPFSLRDRSGCLRLYAQWMQARKATCKDSLYRGMLDDSCLSLRASLDAYKHLDLVGRVVKIDSALKAFTFGYALNDDTFCILYEITDLSVKGAAQFIFREFCRELKNYRYINIMDDSGLENLKIVKESYRPLRLVPNYIVTRNNAQ